MCTIPPTSPGFYFCQGMNKSQYRGGGEPRCLRLPALGRAVSRRPLIQQELEPPGHCRFNRYFVQHRRFRKGTVSNPGCKQGWEKSCVCVCVCMGLAFKIWGEFSTCTNKADIHTGIKGHRCCVRWGGSSVSFLPPDVDSFLFSPPPCFQDKLSAGKDFPGRF